MAKISSNEADYLSYLEMTYPEESFELGRSIRAGETIEGAPWGGVAYFVYFGKNAMYFTELEALNLSYIETEVWSYSEKNILSIRLTKTFNQILTDIVYFEENSLYLRQLGCGRFDIFNKFNRKNYAHLLQGESIALIYKAPNYNQVMQKIAITNEISLPEYPLGFQVDQNS